ncbi:MAG: NAD(P)-dependent alcohol dehydrogenase [Synechococcales bacterium]|nr:NAD(P)-dependent alcohol dehydrogenase [Synechococcales bacterium]
MKAIVYQQYGSPDVLQIVELPQPVPKDNEILIKIYATTVTSGDRRLRSLDMPPGFGLIGRLIVGWSQPRQPILGTELAGEVVAIGSAVQRFKVGDRVVAFSGMSMGCYAEYKCMPEDGLVVLKPANLSDAEAAALSFGGTTVLDFFRRANLQAGEKVLINGASGAVGSAAVQLAHHVGAEVTAVCSGANTEWVRSLGAQQVIDYHQTNFMQNGETYDVIVDTVGTAPFARCQHSLSATGRLLLVLASLPAMLQSPWISFTTQKKVIAAPVAERLEDLQSLAHLAESGVFKPIIDRIYPFEQIAEAHRYVDTGHKKGNVVIDLQSKS